MIGPGVEYLGRLAGASARATGGRWQRLCQVADPAPLRSRPRQYLEHLRVRPNRFVLGHKRCGAVFMVCSWTTRMLCAGRAKLGIFWKSGSQGTPPLEGWREKDSNPRSPVGGTTLFATTAVHTKARVLALGAVERERAAAAAERWLLAALDEKHAARVAVGDDRSTFILGPPASEDLRLVGIAPARSSKRRNDDVTRLRAGAAQIRERDREFESCSLQQRVRSEPGHSYNPACRIGHRCTLAAVIQEAYVQGVSTRSVDELVKAVGMTGISKSQVSRLCAEIDDKIAAFLNRPLEGDWPYLWLDATYVKTRANGRIVSVAVIVAVAVNSDGRREVLGMAIGASEAETFWTDFLRSLARRGLRGVKLVISDAHEGLKAAVARVLHASWQRCRVHFMRNVLAHAGKQGRRVVAAFIATAFAQEDAEMARLQWRQVANQLRPKVAKLAALMDEAEADVLAFMSFPKDHRPKIHSTIPWSALMARSSAAPTLLASSPTRTPSPAWSAPSCSSRTMNRRCSAPAT